MKVHINGESREVADGVTVAALLAAARLDPRYLAVEVNRQVVPRGKHGDTWLRDGDEIEIVTLVGGG